MFPTSIAAIPPGALDLTGEAVRRRRTLQRATMVALEDAGYEELIPPTFEYEDTFVRAGGAGVAERLVRFPDRDGAFWRSATILRQPCAGAATTSQMPDERFGCVTMERCVSQTRAGGPRGKCAGRRPSCWGRETAADTRWSA